MPTGQRMTKTDNSPAKRKLLEELLEKGMVMVTVDARHGGVTVPSHLAHDPQLRLNLSYRFGLPMSIADDAVHATLTFGGQPFACKMPWPAVYLVVSHVTGQPFLFPEDVPEEILLAGDTAPQVGDAPIPAAPLAATKPKLAVISTATVETDNPEDTNGASAKANGSSGSAAEDANVAPPATDPSRPKRGHLRVVK